MVRKPRIHFSGAIYHVVVRGNNKAKVFAHAKDKQFYLQKVLSYRKQYSFELLIYTVMDNHSHKVIRVSDTPLSKIMHGIQRSYARYYNDTHGQNGHVFEDRYKAYLCDNDSYLLTLLRYIHLNPVKAGLTTDLSYEWSSHLNYSGLKNDELVSTEFIYGILTQGIDSDQVGSYRSFIEAPLKEKTDMSPHIIAGKLAPAMSDDETEYIEKTILPKLLVDISEVYGINVTQLLSKSRIGSIAAAKKELIMTLFLHHHIPVHKIAKIIGVSKSYISQVINKVK